jgi:hypothetical protein
MAKSNKSAELLKLLGQNAPTATPALKSSAAPATPRPSTRTEQSDARTKRPHERSAPPNSARGKAIQFYLHEPDEKLIREFAVWLAPHRKRINDSLVVKAVLRAAKTGPDLLAAYDEGLAVSKAHQKKKRVENA